MTVVRYRDFLEKVNELGFMTLGCRAFPSLFEYVTDANYFSKDPDTDPWLWKDRAAEEKKLAYGCILGRNKGFVAPRLYPVFYAAFRPSETIEEMWEAGKLSPTTRQLWKLFKEEIAVSTDEIRQVMGVTKKHGGSRVDTSLRELQQMYFITVSGNKQKLNKLGEPYGWSSIVYETVDSWVQSDWLEGKLDLDPRDARETILELASKISRGCTRRELVRLFGF